MNEEINISCLNVRSLKSKNRRLALSTAILTMGTDVIILTETWLTKDILDAELDLPNYHIYRCDRVTDSHISRHGGVIIAIKNDINHSHVPMNISPSVEAVAISLILKDSSVLLVGAYSPPEQSNYRWSLDCWSTFLQEIRAQQGESPIMIMGDFNLPKVNWNTRTSGDPLESEIIQLLDEQNLNQLIKFNTTSVNILDLILTNMENLILNVFKNERLTTMYGANGLSYSDHYGITATMQATTKIPDTRREATYSFGRANYQHLDNLINLHPFTAQCWSNPNVLIEEWYRWLDSLMKQSVPRKSQHRTNLPPWVRPKTSHCMKQLNTLQNRLKRRPTETIIAKVNDKEEQVRVLLQENQITYESSLADGRNSKQIYKYLNCIRKSTPIPPTIRFGEKMADSDHTQAELFNEYFCSVYETHPVTDESPTIIPEATLEDFDTSPSTISSILKKLDTNKSRGPDNLPPALFKQTQSLTRSISTTLFNKIKQTSNFPEQWKIGRITPIFKKGNRAYATNYRPITLLNIVPKLLERCIFNAVYPFVSNLLHTNQHGFRPKRSANLQLLQYLDNIYRGLDKPSTSIKAVYVDFSKAFDKINHDLLLRKLAKIGIGGKLLQLIRSYLTDRKQFVKIGRCSSSLRAVLSGVPQGSILGPLLFLVYSMDLTENMATLPYTFADDTKLLQISDTRQGSSDTLQQDVTRLKCWSDRNHLPFNIDKCHIIDFRPSRGYKIQIQLGCHILKEVDEVEDLGILINSKLSWKDHIDSKCSKANSVLFLLKRNLSSSLPLQQKLNLYKTLIVPIFSYSSSTWCASRYSMAYLERIQRRCSKWITCYAEATYVERLTRLNILPLSLHLQISDLLLLNSIVNNRYDIDWNENIQLCGRNRENRIFNIRSIHYEVQRSNFWYRTRD
jgi:hypothetical protein